MTSPPAPLHRVTRWQLWRLPANVLGAMLAVEVLAVVLSVSGLALMPEPPDRPTTVLFAILVVSAIGHTEIVAGIERVRRYSAETHHVNLTSVWTFAAAVLLPAPAAAVLVVLVYVHLHWRVLRPVPLPDRRPAYREVFNAATVVVAVHGAAAVVAATRPGGLYEGVPASAALVLTLLVYTVVNTCLVLGAVAIINPDARIGRILLGGDELALELATLSLGALTALGLQTMGPGAVVLAIPPIVALHRSILVRHLRERADTDVKTGLLNHAAWKVRGAHELQRAERENRQAALLILDLDHFKEINDRHGHLYGDEVLEFVARALRSELREHDLIGRFGGEEFVVLLPRVSGPDGYDELHHVAERLRARIAGNPAPGDRGPHDDGAGTDTPPPVRESYEVTVSIGGALFPSDGADMTTLLEIADTALYAAKHAGRDAVRIGPRPFRFPAPDPT
ncbi:GGDEF domain-containing protein [Pseudonocardia sp. HH130630-07]|uniref:GGDEF domain-containing protein n=1 Tax=Pseudonocardia sp. HH130630-07 TaxID=1690815 RepID=UPI0008150948|nr:GGDEF domain-containing protein [Pseudonocardia sp. HH130630-07]ANY05028.1 hypothetical protein AFB00_00310 [Pseudonocardia sp. HH130630-07]